MILTGMILLGAMAQSKSSSIPIPHDKAGLPFPFRVEERRMAQGDYLAPYTFLKDREKDYLASEMWANVYREALATYESFIGLTGEAVADFDKLPGTANATPLEKDPLEGYSAVNAVDYLLKKAATERVVMIGEVHHMPQTRAFGIRLLKGLWDRGYRYLAAEAFSTPTAPEYDPGLNKRTYPIQKTGFYTKEPVFGDFVRRARKLGFTLVAYEADHLNDVKPEEQAQAREDREAAKLKQIFDKDPQAKVLVWNGYGHNSELADKKWAGIVLMGRRFTELTGINPFTINLNLSVGQSTPNHENPVYRYASDHGAVNEPTVFLRNDIPYSAVPESNDCSVFLPRPKLEMGRPDWLRKELHRYPFPLPEKLVAGPGRHLAQAFYQGEPATATPVDQILLKPGERSATLMVPPARIWVRVLDEQGRPSKVFRFKMTPLDRESDEEETVTDRKLADELTKRVETDQKARNRMIELNKQKAPENETKAAIAETQRSDRDNTDWLKHVVDTQGWPTNKMVGTTGSHNAWLLVQHADLDIPFQRRCLDLMKPLVAKGEVSKLDFAYLTDRVLLAEGKKQIYGTQATAEGGKWVIRPVEDPPNLDRRRAQVGLQPVGEYLKEIERAYGPPKARSL